MKKTKDMFRIMAIVAAASMSLLTEASARDAGAPGADGPVLRLECQAVDMGVFRECETSERVVSFTNDGNRPLVIYRIFSGCGCTVPSFSRDTVPPGGSGEIKVLFKGAGRDPGSFRKILRIRSNALNDNEMLMVEGRIRREIRK